MTQAGLRRELSETDSIYPVRKPFRAFPLQNTQDTADKMPEAFRVAVNKGGTAIYTRPLHTNVCKGRIFMEDYGIRQFNINKLII